MSGVELVSEEPSGEEGRQFMVSRCLCQEKSTGSGGSREFKGHHILEYDTAIRIFRIRGSQASGCISQQVL